MFIAMLLAACGGDPPTVDLVDPAKGEAGAEIRIVGGGFTDSATATLGGVAVAELTFRGAATLDGVVPAGLAPGPHDLVVTSGEQSVTLAGAFTAITLDAQDVGAPCAGEFTAYSQLSTAREQFVIQRHYKKNKGKDVAPEVARIAFRDVARVEYQEAVLEGGPDDGKTCSAIWVVEKSGARHLFDDDTEENLQARANEIAVGVQKPFKRVE